MHRIAGVVLAVVLLAAACGSDDPDNVSSTSTGSAVEEGSTDGDTPADPEDAADGPGTAAVADGWTATLIGPGTKPVLALDGDDQPAIAYLFEDVASGFVAYAGAADGWAIESLTEGYFYGPIGLDFDPDGQPHIAYHDHQADTFDQNLGDLTYAVRDGSEWRIQAAASDGHDGWDSTIRIGADGVVRAAGIDPAQFSRSEGVEYYELVDGEWVVEEIGSGPTDYEWNVDLQVAADSTVGLTYFATETQDLIFASRVAGGTWTLDTVAAEGDVGRFSSFAFDADGATHISYWNADTAAVTYATNQSGSWESTLVASLENVQFGFEAARRITSLALDPTGSAIIAYSDTSGVWLARLGDDGQWTSDQLVSAGSRPLGQLVSLAVDGVGGAHLSYFEVTGNSPLSGEIFYVSVAGE